jgi:hypothetical protein
MSEMIFCERIQKIRLDKEKLFVMFANAKIMQKM